MNKTTFIILALLGTVGCRAGIDYSDIGDDDSATETSMGDMGDDTDDTSGGDDGEDMGFTDVPIGDGDGDGDGDGSPEDLPGLGQRCNPHLALDGGFACDEANLVCQSDKFDPVVGALVFRCREFVPVELDGGEFGDTCNIWEEINQEIATCSSGACIQNYMLPPGFNNDGAPSDMENDSCTLHCNPSIPGQCGNGMDCFPWTASLSSLDPEIAADGPFGVCLREDICTAFPGHANGC